LGLFPVPLERPAAQRVYRPFRHENKKRIRRRCAFNALGNNQSTRSGFDDSFTSQNDLTDSSGIDYSPAANRADLLLPGSAAAPPILSHRPNASASQFRPTHFNDIDQHLTH